MCVIPKKLWEFRADEEFNTVAGLETEEVAAIHLVAHAHTEGEREPSEIPRDIAAHPESAIHVVHLAVGLEHVQVLALLEAPAEQVGVRDSPSGASSVIPEDIPYKRSLDSQFVAQLEVVVFDKGIVLPAQAEQHRPAEAVQEHRFHAKAVKTVDATPLARLVEPVQRHSKEIEREILGAHVRFVEAVHLEVHVFVQLVVPHGFPLVAHEPVRHVRIKAKTAARGDFHRPPRIETVDVVAEFRGTAHF